MKRKIEKSAEATLNIGDMQFLKIRTAISEDIEAETEEDFAKADIELWDVVAKDVRRGMWRTLKTLGKTTDADKKFFEICAQRVQETKKAPETTNKEQETKSDEQKNT